MSALKLIFSHADPVYTPAQPRPASTGLFAFNVTQVSSSGSPSLVVTVQHKDSNDSTWGNHTDFAAVTTAGAVAPLSCANLKEQIRLKLVMGGTNAWERIFITPPTA